MYKKRKKVIKLVISDRDREVLVGASMVDLSDGISVSMTMAVTVLLYKWPQHLIGQAWRHLF